jgi:hypothetical protein
MVEVPRRSWGRAVTVAALFVRADGPYAARKGVEPFDVSRDARTYRGPWPVVAHPPCARWGRYWWADGSTSPGIDGGLFEFALGAVRAFGGVLEHPAHSHAFRRFDLGLPSRGHWSRNIWGDWHTEVDQGSYGHRAQKSTWLLARSPYLPRLDWEPTQKDVYLTPPGRCSPSRPRPTCHCARCVALFGTPDRAPVERMGKREQELTPELFASLLLRIASAAENEQANQDRDQPEAEPDL